MRIHVRRRPVAATAVAVLVLFTAALGACSESTTGQDSGTANTGSNGTGTGNSDASWPVTVQMDDNSGAPLEQTITREPQRVVAIGQNIAELMVSFDQQDRIVGTGYLDGADSYYREQLDALPVVSEQVPSTEAVMAVKPDLIISMSFAMTEDKLGTPQSWANRGVPVVLVDNYTVGRDLDSYFGDIRNIGTALGISERTQHYIDQERGAMDQIAARYRQSGGSGDSSKRPKVLLVASGGSNKLTYNYYSPSLGLADEMVEAAGGEYLKVSDATSAEMSDEMIVKADPDFIIMTQFQKGESAKEKEKLTSNPRLSNVTAVREGRVMLVDYSTTVRGTPHLAELTGELADFIHQGDGGR